MTEKSGHPVELRCVTKGLVQNSRITAFVSKILWSGYSGFLSPKVCRVRNQSESLWEPWGPLSWWWLGVWASQLVQPWFQYTLGDCSSPMACSWVPLKSTVSNVPPAGSDLTPSWPDRFHIWCPSCPTDHRESPVSSQCLPRCDTSRALGRG